MDPLESQSEGSFLKVNTERVPFSILYQSKIGSQMEKGSRYLHISRNKEQLIKERR